MPSSHLYRAAWWIPGAHLRTLWRRIFRRAPPFKLRHERWPTPDDDFLDIYRMDAEPGQPRLLLLHGLEGGMNSHYVGTAFAEARRRGWGADLMTFRSCGPELNRARRFYHSGETTDLAFVVSRIQREFPVSPIFLAGVSLGGNVLLKWLGEQGDALPRAVLAAAAVSVPFDLARGARRIGTGFSRFYEWHFVRSLRRKALGKLERYPDLVETQKLDAVRTLWEFDDAVTSIVHGFKSAADYYEQSSAIHFLDGVRRPTLLLSAVDDPFLPRAVLEEVRAIANTNSALHLEFVEKGGHVGFVSGRNPWRPFHYAEWRIMDFFATRLAAAQQPSAPPEVFTPAVSVAQV